MDCAEDLALVGRLEEDDEAGDDGDVGELAAGVFASGDGGGRGVGGEGGEEGGLRGDGSGDAAFDAAVGLFEVGNC